jgi:hypothetical protein
MKKIIILAVLFLVLSSTSMISTAALHVSIKENSKEADSIDNAIKLRVLSIAFPKIARTGRPIFLLVLWPMFLTDGFIHYDWNDGTFQDNGNFVKHIFMQKGTYAIEIELDTIFGLEAVGVKRVFII